MEVDATVRDLATRSFVGVSESDTVREAAALMAEAGDDAVVVRGGEPVGHLDSGTVLELVADGRADAHTVGEVMGDAVPTVDADSSLGEAAAMLATEQVGQLLVRNGTDVLGVLTERDVVAAAALPGTERAPADDPARTDRPADEGFSEQSVCEGCGSFAPDLASVAGQLLCADCRQV